MAVVSGGLTWIQLHALRQYVTYRSQTGKHTHRCVLPGCMVLGRMGMRYWNELTVFRKQQTLCKPPFKLTTRIALLLRSVNLALGLLNQQIKYSCNHCNSTHWFVNSGFWSHSVRIFFFSTMFVFWSDSEQIWREVEVLSYYLRLASWRHKLYGSNTQTQTPSNQC